MHSSQVPFDNPLSFWNRLLPHAVNLLAWGLLIGLIYLLRSFFLLIFLTFVFAYLQTRVGRRVEGFLPNRIVRVVVVALAFISVLTAAGIFLVPKQLYVFRMMKLFLIGTLLILISVFFSGLHYSDRKSVV